MNNVSEHKHSLDTTSKKFTCPACGQKRFVKYVDNKTGEYVADDVGRCDRENNCGYHKPPREYFETLGTQEPGAKAKKPEIAFEQRKDISYLSLEEVEQSLENVEKTNFAIFLHSLLGKDVADQLLEKYFVGNAGTYYPGSCIFWRIDQDANVRTGKVMYYNKETGKRNKAFNPIFVHSKEKAFNLQLCFFGEHLLAEYPDMPVGMVESEKTAIIASHFLPEMIWLATGGKSGCKWKEYEINKVLKDRNIILFPDFGYDNKQTGKTCYQHWRECAEIISKSIPCTIKVSRLLEEKFSEKQRSEDLDLADVLIKGRPQNPNTDRSASNETGKRMTWREMECFTKEIKNLGNEIKELLRKKKYRTYRKNPTPESLINIKIDRLTDDLFIRYEFVRAQHSAGLLAGIIYNSCIGAFNMFDQKYYSYYYTEKLKELQSEIASHRKNK